MSDIQDREAKLYMQAGRRMPVTLVRGEGTRVWDEDGKEYLDFIAGIATTSLGHSDPELADVIAERLRSEFASGSNTAPGPAPAPQPDVAAAPLAELTVYFGRVAALSDGSITVTGSGGAITLAITDGTERVGALPAAIGALVTVLAGEGTVQLLIVVG